MKNVKTIMFASLIMAMILPFSGMNYANADEQTITPYTLEEIDSAFTNSEGYVIYTETNRMIVLEKQMKQDGVSEDDIKIMSHWAKVNNKMMKANESGDRELVNQAFDIEREGKFQVFFNSEVTPIDPNNPQPTPMNYFSSSACGITFGQTSHPHVRAELGLSGYSSQSDVQQVLVDMGYEPVWVPATDPALVYRDYSKTNWTGVGGCDNGEFRDQHVIYPDIPENAYAWYTMTNMNEPNPNLTHYPAPTYWWNTYVIGWHYDQW